MAATSPPACAPAAPGAAVASAWSEWTADLPDPPERLPDPELEEVLPSLGYVP